MGTPFNAVLTTAEMSAVFNDNAIAHAMLRFEEALAHAQAAEGMIPLEAANAIASCCRAELYDFSAIIVESRTAGSLAIPLIKALTRMVRENNEPAAGFVHWGSTSQDVIDTAMVLATRRALVLIEAELGVKP